MVKLLHVLYHARLHLALIITAWVVIHTLLDLVLEIPQFIAVLI